MGGAISSFPIVTNGKVFAGANGVVCVWAVPPADRPAAALEPDGDQSGGRHADQLSWTNNFCFSPATGNRLSLARQRDVSADRHGQSRRDHLPTVV
jgi:hypothetical protein